MPVCLSACLPSPLTFLGDENPETAGPLKRRPDRRLFKGRAGLRLKAVRGSACERRIRREVQESGKLVYCPTKRQREPHREGMIESKPNERMRAREGSISRKEMIRTKNLRSVCFRSWSNGMDATMGGIGTATNETPRLYPSMLSFSVEFMNNAKLCRFIVAYKRRWSRPPSPPAPSASAAAYNYLWHNILPFFLRKLRK